MQVVLTVSINDKLRQRLAAISARDGIKLSHVTQAAITAGLTAQGELPHSPGVAGTAGTLSPA